MAQLQSTLASYIADAEGMLRDKTNNLYSQTDITDWVNKGIRHRDMDLAINRIKYSFTLSAGVFQYTIDQVLSTGTLVAGPANVEATDLLSVYLIPLGAPTSSPRYPLQRWPYSDLGFLLATSYPSYPVAYSMFGTSTIMLGPPPAAAYPAEFDFFGYSPPLVNPTDLDPVPYPWTEPVPYYVCYRAKIQQQRFDLAREFYNPDPRTPGLYQKSIGTVRARGRPIAVRNPWNTIPRGVR
jgi:hypothetical protein